MSFHEWQEGLADVIHSPLSVPVSKNKKFILNLNNYRNVHYQTLNKAKHNYKAIISDQVSNVPKCQKIKVHYKLFPKTRRKTDIGNVVSIHKKFFEDALVELGKLPDDNYEYVIKNTEEFGQVDKNNPRVEIYITEIA